jgi:hypothetical protein
MNKASMRIGVLHFSHETVTFLKNDTTLEDFFYPTEPFLGTIRLDKLPYENVDLKQYYPYGNPVFPG